MSPFGGTDEQNLFSCLSYCPPASSNTGSSQISCRPRSSWPNAPASSTQDSDSICPVFATRTMPLSYVARWAYERWVSKAQVFLGIGQLLFPTQFPTLFQSAKSKSKRWGKKVKSRKFFLSKTSEHSLCPSLKIFSVKRSWRGPRNKTDDRFSSRRYVMLSPTGVIYLGIIRCLRGLTWGAGFLEAPEA